MSRSVFNALKLVTLGALLSGCGLTQTISDSTASTADAIFYKQLKTLHLDISARTASNTDATNMSALSVPTMVRVYQLRDNKLLQQASYELLLNDGDNALGPDLLEQHTVIVKPGEGMQLDVPLDKSARFVAVVALFHTPDYQMKTWQISLNRDDLEPEQARVIELGDARLTLRPLAEE